MHPLVYMRVLRHQERYIFFVKLVIDVLRARESKALYCNVSGDLDVLIKSRSGHVTSYGACLENTTQIL
jgi:hypothetical protein